MCHSSADKPAVRTLYFNLLSDASYVEPWLDKESLLPGQKWAEAISRAVRDSDIVLVCLSKSSIKKTGYVQKEIKYALDVAEMHPEEEIFLIPVKLEECDIPFRLRHLHYLNLFEEEGFKNLLRSLMARAKRLGIDIGIRNPRPYSAREREEIIIRIIAEELDVDESAITRQVKLKELGDNIDATMIRHRLEAEFDVELSQEDSKAFQIVADVFNAPWTLP